MEATMTEIDLRPYLLPKHRSVFAALRNLSNNIGSDHWCLVGGLMVLTVGAQYRAAGRRSEGTKDGDVVVDLVADPNMLQRVTSTLLSHGFVVADIVGGSGDHAGDNVARCTLVFYEAQIDILCPDGTPEDMLDGVDGMRSIAIPGGTRALELSEPVDICFSDDEANAEFRCPTLHGALIAKAAAAVDARTRDQPRHIQDVAFLLTLIEDPTELAETFTERDRDTLRQTFKRIPTMPTWDYVGADDRRLAEAAIRLLS
jgi:hypothetical protein